MLAWVAYSHRYCNIDTIPDAIRYTHEYVVRHANEHPDFNGNTFANSHTERQLNSNQHTDQNTNSHANTKPLTHTEWGLDFIKITYKPGEEVP